MMDVGRSHAVLARSVRARAALVCTLLAATVVWLLSAGAALCDYFIEKTKTKARTRLAVTAVARYVCASSVGATYSTTL